MSKGIGICDAGRHLVGLTGQEARPTSETSFKGLMMEFKALACLGLEFAVSAKNKGIK